MSPETFWYEAQNWDDTQSGPVVGHPGKNIPLNPFVYCFQTYEWPQNIRPYRLVLQ
jgi:hypothetical protein